MWRTCRNAEGAGSIIKRGWYGGCEPPEKSDGDGGGEALKKEVEVLGIGGAGDDSDPKRAT